jgi:hypothetical protein
MKPARLPWYIAALANPRRPLGFGREEHIVELEAGLIDVPNGRWQHRFFEGGALLEGAVLYYSEFLQQKSRADDH